MVFPKHKRAAAWLSARFHDGVVQKRYLALVSGSPEQEGWTVGHAIGKIGTARHGIMAGGRTALTEFRLLATSGKYSLIEARPMTGRTHQIRVHLESSGLPIVGDSTYGGELATRMMLHCTELVFKDENNVEIRLNASPDQAFADFMQQKRLVL